jgi:hypothetical protein
MKAELELPKVPQGWTYDGFREIANGEKYFDGEIWADWTGEPSDFLAFVLKSNWRPATDADVGKFCRCVNNGDAYEGKLVHVYGRRDTRYLCVINHWHTTFQSCEVQDTAEPEVQQPEVRDTEVQQAKYMKVLRRYERDYWDDEGRRIWWVTEMNEYVGGVYKADLGRLVARIDDFTFPREVLKEVEVFPIDNQDGLWYFLSEGDVTRVGDLQYYRGKWVFPAFDYQVDSSVIVRRVK